GARIPLRPQRGAAVFKSVSTAWPWRSCVSSVPARKQRHTGAGTIRDDQTLAVHPANGDRLPGADPAGADCTSGGRAKCERAHSLGLHISAGANRSVVPKRHGQDSGFDGFLFKMLFTVV